MTKPVYLEDWGSPEILRSGASVRVHLGDRGVLALIVTHETWAVPWAAKQAAEELPGRARLIAAAPALAQALLMAEWNASELNNYDERVGRECVFCLGIPTERRVRHGQDERTIGHNSGCIVDAALTAAGLPDQASRDEARRMIAEAKR